MACFDEPFPLGKRRHYCGHVFTASFIPDSGSGLRRIAWRHERLSIQHAERPILGESNA